MANSQIRSFAKFFTNLTPNQQREFERIFADLENSLQLTSLANSLELLKRSPDIGIPTPQISVFPTVRGAIIEWPAVENQRVTFYEVDISPQSNFSSIRTFPVFSTSFTIDGLTATNFVRVRAVRNGGFVSPYSEVGIIAPNLFDIQTHTLEDFYVPIDKDTQLVIGGAGTSLDYVPINPQGESMIWGGVSLYGDPNTALSGTGDIIMRVFAKTVDGESGIQIDDTEFWRMTATEFFGTYAIGPFTVPHPELNNRLQIRFTVDDTALGNTNPSSEVRWIHLQSLELGID